MNHQNQYTIKNIAKILVVPTLLALLSLGCDQEELSANCEGENVQQVETYFEDELAYENALENVCVVQNISDDDKEVNLVIRTQADYEKYVTCSNELPVIDFDKYFILAGRYRHHQCAVFASQSVLICDNTLVYNVRMREQICAAITNVFYMTVLEKKHSNLPIKFDVKFLSQ